MSRQAHSLRIQTASQANERVDELVQELQRFFKKEYNVSVDEVVKGGSLGHGTAIPGDFDLDLVLYSQDNDADYVAEMGMKEVLKKLDRFLSSHFPYDYKEAKQTAFSLQFRFHNDIDVDLLPSPYWSSPEELHRFLEDIKDEKRRRFSCNASKWQVQFFKKQPNEVKEYIRRFKAWRNQMWPKHQDHTGRPKSFLLSLLMVEAYRRTHDKSLSSIQRELVQMIRNHHTLNIKWNDVYSSTHHFTRQEFDDHVKSGRFRLISSIGGIEVVYDHEQQRKITFYPATTEVPLIQDCANPFNNVYESGIGKYSSRDPEGTYRPGTGNWTKFAELIHTFDINHSVEKYQTCM